MTACTASNLQGTSLAPGRVKHTKHPFFGKPIFFVTNIFGASKPISSLVVCQLAFASKDFIYPLNKERR